MLLAPSVTTQCILIDSIFHSFRIFSIISAIALDECFPGKCVTAKTYDLEIHFELTPWTVRL